MTLSDSLMGEHGRAVEATTLRHLVEAVGAPLLHVLAAPRGLDQRIRTTVLLDASDELADEPDALLLLSGVRADQPLATEIVEVAATRGFRAVVVKRRGGDLSTLVTAASLLGVTVLAAADEVPWRQLDALLLSVIAARGVGPGTASGVGDELFALANAIAAVTGGSVAIEDLDRRLLAYSSMAHQRIDSLREQGILDRRVPNLHRHVAQYGAVFAANGIVRFPESPEELARTAIAIRAGSQPLGTIWAIESVDGLDRAGEQAIAEGAQLAALKILRTLNVDSLELQLRENALLRSLDGSLSAEEATFRLSLPGGAELALIGFAALPDDDGVMPLVTHVASALARHVAAHRPDASLATTSRAVYVLLPGSSDKAASRFASTALLATGDVFPDRVRAAIAQTSTDPSELPAMRREIDDILRATSAQLDLPSVANMGDASCRVLLARVADLLVHEPRLRHPGVEAMVAHDVEHHTDYAASVSAWFDAVGDMAGAAAELGVHPNTLRYRLRRAHELFAVSLDHPDDRLSVWMQLRLAR